MVSSDEPSESSSSPSKPQSQTRIEDFDFADPRFRSQDLKDVARVTMEWAKAHPYLATTAAVGIGLGVGAILRRVGFRGIFGAARALALPAVIGYAGEEWGKYQARKKYH